MPNTLVHAFQSSKLDDPDTTLVRPSDWNHEHVFSGGTPGAFLIRDTVASDGVEWTSAAMQWNSGVGRLFVEAVTVSDFRLNAGPDTVGFVGPIGAPFDPLWTLPSTLGAAGETFVNDGTGVLSWGSPSVDLATAATGILAVAHGGTGLAAGTSGGILAFTATGTLASSGALTANAPVIGGGAGVVPTVGTRSGNTVAFVTLAGSATSGTCVQFDASGNAASTGAPCGSGGGSGITSLNLASGAAQTFGNETNLTIVTNTGTGVHQLTWASTLAAVRGGTGLNTSASTGVPSIAAGTWSVAARLSAALGGTGIDTSASTGVAIVTAGTWSIPATLTKALGGTGGTGGTDTHVGYWTATGLSGSASHVWDNTNTTLIIGTGSTGVPVATATALMVTATGSGAAVARIESSLSAASTVTRTALQLVRTRSAGGMADGFGLNQDFILRDTDAIDNIVGRFTFVRAGSDGTATFALQTGIGGVLGDRLTVSATGQMFYTPTTTVGTFGFGNNGTRRTEVQFYANNGVDVVGFIAPATTTGGSHIWTLPSTLGVANSVAANDGAGVLSWSTALILTSLQVGPTPSGGQAAGPLQVTLDNSDNVNPFQAILSQLVNGSSAGVTPATVANDKVAVSGRAYRGAGGTSPIYGGNFGVTFSTAGVANGIEIGVENSAGSTGGQGLWVNGNGANHRDNAILIDTQNASKWTAGIRFSEGNTGGGATGTTLSYGIIFDKSSDADFIVIRPRVGASNPAIRITDPTFAVNTFAVLNDGSIGTAADIVFGGRMAGGTATLFGPAGSINTSGNIDGANVGVPAPSGQFFARGLPGFTGSKVAGACTLTITGGIITNVTGC